MWPIRKLNTFFNIVSAGSVHIVERLGKYHSTKEAGFYFAIPVIDEISYVINTKELTNNIDPLEVITKDNVEVKISGKVFYKVRDPLKTAYGSENPIEAINDHAKSSMRNCIGQMTLDESFRGRSFINNEVIKTISDAAHNWGIVVTRYEVSGITTEKTMKEVMLKQASAERSRIEEELNAEAVKRSLTLKSEGERQKMINESEGQLIKIKNESEGQKYKLTTEAEGAALAEITRAKATSQTLRIITEAISGSEKSEKALLYLIADKNIDMYSKIGSTSNTMFFSDRPADINSVIAQAKAIVDKKF
jgi:regulator of protease activity HflC (stomatin/prohibitin superfamily)